MQKHLYSVFKMKAKNIILQRLKRNEKHLEGKHEKPHE
jgi:hypothetical protein